jgi:hypothetical protein
MIGAKSGTTAWPHANGGISVVEWPVLKDAADVYIPGYADPVVDATVADGTNLWMYSGSVLEVPIAQSRFSFETWGNLPVAAGTVVDGRFTVITDAIGTATVAGNTKDGACMKCHAPVDEKSLQTIAVRSFLNADPFSGNEGEWLSGATGVAKAGMHYSEFVIGHNPNPVVFGPEPIGATGSPALIFTYR